MTWRETVSDANDENKMTTATQTNLQWNTIHSNAPFLWSRLSSDYQLHHYLLKNMSATRGKSSQRGLDTDERSHRTDISTDRTEYIMYS